MQRFPNTIRALKEAKLKHEVAHIAEKGLNLSGYCYFVMLEVEPGKFIKTFTRGGNLRVMFEAWPKGVDAESIYDLYMHESKLQREPEE